MLTPRARGYPSPFLTRPYLTWKEAAPSSAKTRAQLATNADDKAAAAERFRDRSRSATVVFDPVAWLVRMDMDMSMYADLNPCMVLC